MSRKEDYQNTHEEIDILRLLTRSQMEIKDGKGHALDAVLADADILIEELRRKRSAARNQSLD